MRMTRRVLRRLFFTALFAVLLLVTAAVGVNVYLNGEYLPRLIKSEQDWVTVEYRLAWTLWPGRLHIEGLRVRGEERGFTWQLSADRALLVADVSELTTRRIHLDDLVLSGTRVFVRPRLHYLDANAERLAALPPLQTQGSAWIDEGPQLAPAARGEVDPWSITFDRLRVEELEDLWIDRFRFNGRADLEALKVQVDAGRILTTGQTQLELRDGTVTVEGVQTLRSLAGKGEATVGALDLVAERGVRLMGTLDGASSLTAEVVALDFLPKLPGVPVPVELAGAAGPLSTSVSVKKGVVQPGAVLRYEAPGASARVGEFQAKGALVLEAKVEEVDGTVRTRSRSTFTGFSLTREGSPPLTTAKRVELELDVPNISLGQADADSFGRSLAAAFDQWPARLKLQHGRVMGEERALQWALTLEALSTDLDLSNAKDRKLTFLQSRARGAKLRIRPRLTQADAQSPGLASHPPIEGLPNPPLMRSGGPTPLMARVVRSPWSIHAVDAVVEELREVWLESYRFEGLATARGGFRYEAGGVFGTSPVKLQIDDGALHIARWSAAKGVKGQLEGQVRPSDLEEAQGYGFFRALSARAEIEAWVDDVNFIRHYPEVPLPTEIGGGQGPINARIALKDGVVQADSRVHWETRGLTASTKGYRFDGPFVFDARWSNTDGEPRLVAEGRVSPYRVTRTTDTRTSLVGGKLITFRMESPKFDLARPSFEPLAHAQIHDGTVPDLRVLNAFVPRDLPLKMEAGAGAFTGKVTFTHKKQAWAEFKVGGANAQLVYDKVQIKGDWSCEAKLSNVDLASGAGDVVSASLVLNNMAMREGAYAKEGWFGRVDLKKGTVRPGSAVLLTGELETTMRDGRPLVAFFVAETDLLPVWARTLVTLQALRATGRFRLGEGLVEVDGLNARGQSVQIRGRVRKQGQRQWGDMLLTSRGQDVGVAIRGTRLEFKLIGAASWYRSQMMEPRW